MQYKIKKDWSILETKNSTDYVKSILRDTKYGEPRYKISTLSQAEEVKAFLNDPQNSHDKSMRDIQTGIPYWNEQKVEYVASNLGHGFLWYFLCGYCGHKVKLLYLYKYTQPPLCRLCLGIDYRRKSRRRGWSEQSPQMTYDPDYPVLDPRREKVKTASVLFVEDGEKEAWWLSPAPAIPDD